MAVIGVGLFLALGKEVTEKERRSAADLEGSTLLADRNGRPLLRDQHL